MPFFYFISILYLHLSLHCSTIPSSHASSLPTTNHHGRRKRFTFHGPILTLTLKDPFANNNLQQHNTNNYNHHTRAVEEEDEDAVELDLLQPNKKAKLEGDEDQQYQQDENQRSKQKFFSSIFHNHSHFGRRNNNHNTNNHAYYSNYLNLNYLAPTLFYSIRSNGKPLPNYVPSLYTTSVSAGYKYDDVKNRPSFIEGELRFRKMLFGYGGWRKRRMSRMVDGDNGDTTSATVSDLVNDASSGGNGSMAFEVDVAPSYMVKEKKGVLVVRIGGEGGGGINEGGEVPAATTTSAITTTTGVNAYGCYALAQFVMTKGKKYLEHVRGSYKMSLPFHAVGSISITPSYDFLKDEHTCNIIGKSSSGRTAAVLDLNWDNPTLSVVHALDQRNTISPEISLNDAKIVYNWSVALDSGAIKTRVDPSSAIQVTWMDQCSNGKWVTDFKLPLVGNPGPLAGDIRVRRQFIF